ncbi:hypothetical protein ACFWPQ_01985 [Streptomyces sp. NPDC058464]|uniref:hypothetical protein n=1 Tax=Streptomyces sp. NPDC058464 TaxID=3346511 RepID=UPI00365DBB0D
MTPPETPADWIDGHPQLEAIAAAVWEQCRTEGTSLVVDDPRNIAVAALAAVSAVPSRADTLMRAHTALASHAGRQQAALTRFGEMADAWEQQLPEVIRTPAVVSAIRAALELATVQRKDTAVWGVDTAAGKHRLAAADLIDPAKSASAAPLRPAHVGGNAEDCPACSGTDLPYPFLCPGPDTAPALLSGGALRDRIAEALYERERPPRDPHWPNVYTSDRETFEEMADAVLPVLHGCTLRELEQLYRPNTTPSRPPAQRQPTAAEHARRYRYVAAIRRWWDADDGGAEEIAAAVMDVADGESVGLRIEITRLNRRIRELERPAAAPAVPVEAVADGEETCDGCGHPTHPADQCPVTRYGERCACDEPITAKEA